MNIKDNFSRKKTCPRCNLKVYEEIDTCPDCGLIFSRLEIATNKDAKKKILKGDKDFVLKTEVLPKDVSKLKLTLYAIFFGFLGGHCFYVGRYYRGGIILTDFILLLCITIFNSQLSAINDGALLAVLSTIIGFVMFMWPIDLIMIIMKKFKVPIAIDITKDEEIDYNFNNENNSNINIKDINKVEEDNNKSETKE